MKKTTLVKTMLLLCALVVGSSSVWAKTQSWDLTTAKYSSASANLVTWSSLNITFTSAKNGGTDVNSYLGGSGSNTHTRFYTNNILTFTPLNGALISKIELTIASSSGGPSYISTNAGELTNCTSTYSSPKVTVTPTKGTSACSIKVGGSSKNTRVESVVVTYTGGSDAEEATAKFTDSPAFISIGDNYTNALDITPDELAVTYSSGDDDIATIGASTGEVTGKGEGIVEITASWAEQVVGGKTYIAGSKKYELYVGKAIEDGVFDFTGYQNYGGGVPLTTSTNTYAGKDAYVFTAGNITLTTGGDNGKYFAWYNVTDNKNELRFYSGTNFTLAAPAGYAITKVDFTGKSNVEKMTVSSGSLTGNNTASTWTGCAQSVTFTRGGGNPGYYTISVTYGTSVPVTITAAEYATFASLCNFDFSTTGITVYTATDNKTSVSLNEITSGKVPANTPVVLYKAGADGTAINVPVIASADAVGDNDLRVSTGTDVGYMYVLAKPAEKSVGFYPWGGTTDLSAGKVYLQAKALYGARAFLGFNDDVTAIEAVKAQNVVKGEYFNLAGQRVAQPTKGLYIVNGRKVVMK